MCTKKVGGKKMGGNNIFEKSEEKRLDNRVARLTRKVTMGVAALVTAIGVASCGDVCGAENYQHSLNNGKGYLMSPLERASADECPSGCYLKKEDNDRYCCWCPE